MNRQRIGIVLAAVAVVAVVSIALPWLLGTDSPVRRRTPGEPPAAPGVPAPSPLDGGEICPPSDPEVAASFERSPCVLRGLVVDGLGRPLAAEVTVVGLLASGPRVRAKDTGRFRVVLKQPDVVRLGVAADGFRTHVGERIAVRPGLEKDLGTIRLETGRVVAGVVVDDRGTPVPGASCSLEPDEGIESAGWAYLAEATSRYDRRRTAQNGAFKFDGVPEGTWIVRARAGARGDARSVVVAGIPAGREDVRVVVPSPLVARRYAVHVRVFGPDGRRVPGARVWVAQPFDTVHSGRLQSEMDVEAFHPGPTWLVVRDAFDDIGRPLPYAPVAVRLEPTKTALDVYMPAGEPLRGRVVAEGRPVEAILVAEAHLRADGSAAPPAGDARVGEDWVRLRLGTASDSDGSFAFPALPPGRLLLRTEPETPWRVLDPEYVAPGAAEVRVSLAPVARIEGILEAPEGMRLESAAVRFSRSHAGGEEPETTFTACGASATLPFSRAVRSAGPYVVEVLATGNDGLTFAPLVLRDVRAGGPRIVARLARGVAAEGLVVAEDGTPGSDALVRAFPLSASPLSASPLDAAAGTAFPLHAGVSVPSGRADAAGRFRVGGLRPGPWRLVAEVRGARAATEVVVLPEGAREIRLVLAANRYLAGRVVDGAGGSVGDLSVAAFDAEGRPAWAPEVQPSADGWFSLGPLPPGRFRAVAGAGGTTVGEASDDLRVAASDLVESSTGRDLVLSVGPGVRVTGRVLSEEGAPLEAASVVVRGARLARRVATDPDGRFAVTGLPADVYDVEASAGDGRRGTARSTGGEDLEIRLTARGG